MNNYGQNRQDNNQNQQPYNQTQGQYGMNVQNNRQYGYQNNPGQQTTQQQYGQNQGQFSQQQQMIKNPEVNIQHGPQMNDRDFLNDILASEKYLTDGLNTFVREASHQFLFQDIKQILNETHDCERDLLNLMFQDGFYSFQAADQQEVQQTQQKFSNYLSQQDPYGTGNF